MRNPRAAVFFDRDGVLNDAVVKDGKPHPPPDAGSMVLAAGARDVLAILKEAGFALVCVTNQPDVSRGTRSRENIDAMNRKVLEALPLDDLLTCFHDDADGCDCRKPKPGMLLSAAEKWGVNLRRSWMVGDRAGDIAAGRAAGCKTIFIDHGYGERGPVPPADFACAELTDIPEIIGSHSRLEEIRNKEDAPCV